MKILTKAGTLVVLLENAERIWALKASLCLRAQDIISVEWNAQLPDKNTLAGFRLPGTSLPTVFYAGSFWRNSGWEFWYLKLRQPGELVITTNVHKYRKIRLTIDEATAFDVRDWFNKFTTTKNVA